MSRESNIHQWAAQTSVVALEMVVPAVIGVGLDQLFGTAPLFVIIGVFLGMALGFMQLIRIAQSHIQNVPNDTKKTDDNEPQI